jgi:hypothetical protein
MFVESRLFFPQIQICLLELCPSYFIFLAFGKRWFENSGGGWNISYGYLQCDWIDGLKQRSSLFMSHEPVMQ